MVCRLLSVTLLLAACERLCSRQSETLGVAEPPTAGSYRALAIYGSDLVLAGEHGQILQASVEEDFGPTAVRYQAATTSTGTDVVIRGLGMEIGSNIMIAVGDGGVVRRSADRGLTWAPVESGTTADLYAAAFPNFDAPNVEGYVIVGDGVLLRSADLGLTWAPLPLPTGEERLRDVVHVLGSGWYAVGLGGLILYADGNAELWARETSPTERDLLRVNAGIDPTVMIVADEGLLVQGYSQNWEAVELALTGEIADANESTVIMRDGRIARRGYFDDLDDYQLRRLDEPPPPLQRIVIDYQRDIYTDDISKTLVLAEDGRLILLGHRESCGG